MAVELLAPAGDITAARAAFRSGADAVYLGLQRFSARAQAKNFSFDELKRAVGLAKSLGKKVYVTVNTLVDRRDLGKTAETLQEAECAGANGVIVQDLGVARIAREHFPALELHASTQLFVHNLEGVLALKERGFSRVVLAREVPIADIRKIAERCGCELEVFIHGALCYSISGLCLFSSLADNRSGNKGLCAYCCRNKFKIDGNREILPFSMRDLCLAEELQELADAGVASLKIEGRMKSETYVGAVTKFYRERLDRAAETVSQSDLATIFSRRTTTLYAHGWQGDGPVIDPENRTHLGAEAGEVKKLAKDREGRIWMRMHATRALEKHDGLQFEIRGRERPAGFGINSMRLAISRRNVFEAPAGSDVEIELPKGELPMLIKPGMKVWCGHSEAVSRRFGAPGASHAEIDFAGREIEIQAELREDGIFARARSAGNLEASVFQAAKLEKAQNPGKTPAAAAEAFRKWGGTNWRAGKIEVRDDAGLFAPASLLNAARRSLCEKLDEAENARNWARLEKIALEYSAPAAPNSPSAPQKSVKMRLDQWKSFVKESGSVLPAGCDEVVIRINPGMALAEAATFPEGATRLALPVWTKEEDYAKLRTLAKRLAAAGWRKWEAGDVAALRMLRAIGMEDLTADWTLYATNQAALAELAEMGAKSSIESPEAHEELPGQTTLEACTPPMFISLSKPAGATSFTDGARNLESFFADGLWITIDGKTLRKTAPEGASSRTDISWKKDFEL